MLHQVGVSFDLYCDARKHKIKTLLSTFTLLIATAMTLQVKNTFPLYWTDITGLCSLLHKNSQAYENTVNQTRRLQPEEKFLKCILCG